MVSYNRALEITGCESIEPTCVREEFCGRRRSFERAAGGCQNESFPENVRVQCEEDGSGTKDSGPIAYRATSGFFALY